MFPDYAGFLVTPEENPIDAGAAKVEPLLGAVKGFVDPVLLPPVGCCWNGLIPPIDISGFGWPKVFDPIFWFIIP